MLAQGTSALRLSSPRIGEKGGKESSHKLRQAATFANHDFGCEVKTSILHLALQINEPTLVQAASGENGPIGESTDAGPEAARDNSLSEAEHVPYSADASHVIPATHSVASAVCPANFVKKSLSILVVKEAAWVPA